MLAIEETCSGTIRGNVYNVYRIPVADVHVQLENNSGIDVSNSRGEFAVTDIAPGIYTISFSHISYNPHTLEGIEVIEGQETRLDPVILTARIFDASAISVTATRMDIEKEKYTSQINVITRQLLLIWERYLNRMETGPLDQIYRRDSAHPISAISQNLVSLKAMYLKYRIIV